MKISKNFAFEASHMLPKHPGKCARLHGHSWTGHVTIIGDVNPSTGFVMDYYDLNQIINKRIFEPLDHRHLGTWEDFPKEESSLYSWRALGLPLNFYPSSENLLRWIVSQLQIELKNLCEVVLHETCTSAAIWSYSDVFEPGYGKVNIDAFDRR